MLGRVTPHSTRKVPGALWRWEMERSSKSRARHPDESPTMKHNKNHDNVKSDGPQLEPVRFEFTHPTAATICIAGTFNNWQPEAKPMHPLGNGRWLKETVLPPGNYEYCLVVDGRWIPDPLAKETVPNPFGGMNSLLKVASSPEASHLANAEHLRLTNKNK
jgi:1,4-alpha-glucan branching enzyme